MPAADPASKPLLATSVVKPTSSQLSNPEIVVELWLLGRLIPYSRNPRTNDHAARVCASFWPRSKPPSVPSREFM
jgi:hypothetical protein